MMEVSALGMAPVAHVGLTSCVVTGGQLVCTSTSGSSLGIFLVVALFYTAIVVVSVVAGVKVITKAGYSGWWVLILLVPLVGFVMALVFAFSKWPVIREVEMLRAQQQALAWSAPSRGHGPGPGVPGYVGDPPPQGPRPAGPGSAGTFPNGPEGPMAGAPATTGDEPPLPSFGQVLSGGADVPQGSSVVEPPSATPPHQPGPRHPPAGWFPTSDGRLRYWDGSAWTEHFA